MDLGDRDGEKCIQHEVFPQQAGVLRADLVPATDMAHESGIEPVKLGLGQNLPPPARGVGTQEMDDVRDLEDVEPSHHGRAAHAAMLGQRGGLDQTATLAKDEFKQTQKRLALAQMKQLLHITGEIGVEPLGVELGLMPFRQQCGRQAPPHEPH